MGTIFHDSTCNCPFRSRRKGPGRTPIAGVCFPGGSRYPKFRLLTREQPARVLSKHEKALEIVTIVRPLRCGYGAAINSRRGMQCDYTAERAPPRPSRCTSSNAMSAGVMPLTRLA